MFSNFMEKIERMNYFDAEKTSIGDFSNLNRLIGECVMMSTILPPKDYIFSTYQTDQIHHAYGDICQRPDCSACLSLTASVASRIEEFTGNNKAVVDSIVTPVGEYVRSSEIVSSQQSNYSGPISDKLTKIDSRVSALSTPEITPTTSTGNTTPDSDNTDLNATLTPNDAAVMELAFEEIEATVNDPKKKWATRLALSQFLRYRRKSKGSKPVGRTASYKDVSERHKKETRCKDDMALSPKLANRCNHMSKCLSEPSTSRSCNLYPSLKAAQRVTLDTPEYQPTYSMDVAGKKKKRKSKVKKPDSSKVTSGRMTQVLMALTWFSLIHRTEQLPFFKHCNYTQPPNYYKLPNERLCTKPTSIEPPRNVTYQIWGVGAHGHSITGTHCVKRVRSRSCWNNLFGITTIEGDLIANGGLATSECEADPQGKTRYITKPCFPEDVCGWMKSVTSTCSWIERRHVTINIVSNNIIVGGMRTTHCSPQSGLCTLDDQSILSWDAQEIPTCKYLPGPIYEFTEVNNYLVSEEQGVALHILPDHTICGDAHLRTTSEGFYLSSLTNASQNALLVGLELLSVNYVTYKSQITSNTEFSKVWWELCRVSNDQIRFINWMASIDPTAAITHVMNTRDLIGIYNGIGVYYWRCNMVNNYTILQVQNCTQDVPIEYNGEYKSISRSKLEIVEYNEQPCITSLPYALSDGNHTLIWDGKRYKFESINKTKEMYAYIAPQTIWSVRVNLQYLSAKVSDQMQTIAQMIDSNKDAVSAMGVAVDVISSQSNTFPLFGRFWWWEVLSNPVVWLSAQMLAYVYLFRMHRRQERQAGYVYNNVPQGIFLPEYPHQTHEQPTLSRAVSTRCIADSHRLLASDVIGGHDGSQPVADSCGAELPPTSCITQYTQPHGV